ncbi:MAG: hypothetical protein Q9M92_10410 [Enterobacterales bacterium]|nr:hypothetical protein [Enterobacterales bacterium]
MMRNVKSRFVLYVLLIFHSFIVTALIAEQQAPYELGVDYQKIVKPLQVATNIEQLDQLESVSHIELFYWIGCESCYQVEAELILYLNQHPEYTFRRTPLVARVEWRQQAYLQAIIQQIPDQTMGLDVLDLYRQCLTDCEAFTKVESSIEWLLKGTDLDSRPQIDYEKLWQQQKKYQKRADLFSITQVPTIIINETYQVNGSQAQSAKRMLQIIDYLLTLE